MLYSICQWLTFTILVVYGYVSCRMSFNIIKETEKKIDATLKVLDEFGKYKIPVLPVLVVVIVIYAIFFNLLESTVTYFLPLQSGRLNFFISISYYISIVELIVIYYQSSKVTKVNTTMTKIVNAMQVGVSALLVLSCVEIVISML